MGPGESVADYFLFCGRAYLHDMIKTLVFLRRYHMYLSCIEGNLQTDMIQIGFTDWRDRERERKASCETAACMMTHVE